MGTQIGVLFPRVETSLDALAGKRLALDALNVIYQFLSIVRLPDGTPLRTKKGEVTSHLAGVFYRTINLLEHRIYPVYVFDGRPPLLKMRALAERAEVKERFEREWREALARGDLVAAFKKSVMTSRVNDKMLAEVKQLLALMGIPWVQAPSEGEAQAAYMASRGDVWASASQDYDSILFGSPRLVRNLAVAGRKYYPKKGIAVELVPELITLKQVLQALQLTREQLVDAAILVGTDYNEGIYGIGPKKAVKLVKLYGSAERVLKALKVDVNFDLEEVRQLYLKPEVTDNYQLAWREPSCEEVKDFLLKRDFNPERVERGVERLKLAYRVLAKQTEIRRWFE